MIWVYGHFALFMFHRLSSFMEVTLLQDVFTPVDSLIASYIYKTFVVHTCSIFEIVLGAKRPVNYSVVSSDSKGWPGVTSPVRAMPPPPFALSTKLVAR